MKGKGSLKTNKKGAVGGVRKGVIGSTPFKDAVIRKAGAKR